GAGGPRPAGAGGRERGGVPAIPAFRRRRARNWCSPPPASPSKDRANPALAATPPLIASEAKWSSSTTSVDRTPGRADTASKASATIRKAKLGAQKYVGSRSRTWASPSADTGHDETNPSEVIGSARPRLATTCT